jgi:hypothetical protein
VQTGALAPSPDHHHHQQQQQKQQQKQQQQPCFIINTAQENK